MWKVKGCCVRLTRVTFHNTNSKVTMTTDACAIRWILCLTLLITGMNFKINVDTTRFEYY